MGGVSISIYPQISIHALREEGDDVGFLAALLHINFYPRPPRGGRLNCTFNSINLKYISIHALREEGDVVPTGRNLTAAVYFYPRPPRGGRPGADQRHQRQHCISIHALREEGDGNINIFSCAT